MQRSAGRLTAGDYPGLIAYNQPIDTVSVGTLLAVTEVQAGSDRYRKIADALERLKRLRTPPCLNRTPEPARVVVCETEGGAGISVLKIGGAGPHCSIYGRRIPLFCVIECILLEDRNALRRVPVIAATRASPKMARGQHKGRAARLAALLASGTLAAARCADRRGDEHRSACSVIR
jgi:hypothetical protein